MTTVQSTATATLGMAGGIGVLNWLFQCHAQHALVEPDPDTKAFMVGLAAPVVHAIANALSAWFTKRTGIVIPAKTDQPQEQAHA